MRPITINKAKTVPLLKHNDSRMKLDKTGYFLIRLNRTKKVIELGFCNYKNIMLWKTAGKNPKDLIKTALAKKSVSEQYHASYLGRELQKAKVALDFNLQYIQDDELSEIYTKSHPEKIEQLEKLTIKAIQSFFKKAGIKKAVIGVSGGIDSAVALVLTTKALGKSNVLAILSPSRYSSPDSTKTALKLCKTLGVSNKIIPIEEKKQSKWVGVIPEKIKRLQKHFKKLKKEVIENMQAIDRMSILRAIANQENRIVIGTGNKIEATFGYFTVCGDGGADVNIIGDWYKGEVYNYAKHINKEKQIIPEFILTRIPSAELSQGQVDPFNYNKADLFVKLFIDEKQPPSQLLKHFSKKEINKYTSLIKKNAHKKEKTGVTLKI